MCSDVKKIDVLLPWKGFVNYFPLTILTFKIPISLEFPVVNLPVLEIGSGNFLEAHSGLTSIK